MTRISASMAAAPFTHLRQVVADLESAGVDSLHFDLEDGTFVPVMNLGTRIIQELRPLTNLPFDVHLMMTNPEWILKHLAAMGANRVCVHMEACPYPRRTLRMIKKLGLEAGLAFNPATPLGDLTYLSPYLDYVIVLSSEPELPDSPHLPYMLDKLAQAKLIPGHSALEWVTDGGIGVETIDKAVRAGADTLIIGRAIFKNGKLEENIQSLRKSMTQEARDGLETA